MLRFAPRPLAAGYARRLDPSLGRKSLTKSGSHVLVSFMSDAANMKARHEAGFVVLADLGLSQARDLHARALAADDDKAACDLGLAFHRISRSVRQTYALESRLERERRLSEREDRQDIARETLARVQRKRAAVRKAVSGLIWTEAEGDEAEQLIESLDALVWD